MSGTRRPNGSGGRGSGGSDHLIGQILAGYRLQRLLGRGGMGLVFEAISETNGQRAAIKVVHAQLAQSQAIATRFFTEARAASLLEHPGVVRVLDVGQTAEGLSFIVMECLDGVTLASRLIDLFPSSGQQTLRPDVRRVAPEHAEFAFDIAGQIARTLAALHTKGVVHRDLKPDNIFLVRDTSGSGSNRELAKIFDFGLAKLLCDDGSGKSPPQTALGTVLGTPVYMSPEQWSGRVQITDRADVYAAGGIFYELFVGHPPFTSQIIGELMTQHLRKEPVPIHIEAPWVPRSISNLVQRMLAKVPTDRPGMQEVAELIERHTPPRTLDSDLPTAPGATRAVSAEIATSTLAQTARSMADLCAQRTQILPTIPAAVASPLPPAVASLLPPALPLMNGLPIESPPGLPSGLSNVMPTAPLPMNLPLPRRPLELYQGPASFGVFLACLLGVILTGAAAWLVRHG